MDLNEHEKNLQNELTKITSELKGIAIQNPVTNDWIAVPVTEEIGNADANLTADVVEEWDQRRALMVQLETNYLNVVRAIEKISIGTYGLCEICNNPIEADRLHVNHTARTCILHLENEGELPQ